MFFVGLLDKNSNVPHQPFLPYSCRSGEDVSNTTAVIFPSFLFTSFCVKTRMNGTWNEQSPTGSAVCTTLNPAFRWSRLWLSKFPGVFTHVLLKGIRAPVGAVFLEKMMNMGGELPIHWLYIDLEYGCFFLFNVNHLISWEPKGTPPMPAPHEIRPC